MSAIVTREPSRGEGLLVTPQEGSPFFIPILLALELHLHEGDVLSEQQLEDCYKVFRLYQGRRKALDLLAMREHAPRELSIKLQQKGWKREESEAVVRGLRADHLVDEERYTRSFIASRIRKNPEAPSLLRMRLQEKGISPEIIESVMDEFFADEESRAALIAAAIRKAPARAVGDKLTAYLQRKGYSLRDIRHALAVAHSSEGSEG